MSTRHFYNSLEPLSGFAEATNSSLHASLPSDWWVVVADVAGSTLAIENGRYKDVNTVAAATIMAVINVDRSCEIPFVFGGDGATMAIPPHMLDGVKSALLASSKMAKEGFGIELRVGVISAAEILQRNLYLGVSKYRQSNILCQSSFSGFGWNWAESIIKDPVNGDQFLVKDDGSINAIGDFTGFECRWRPVKARHDTKLAIILVCMATDPNRHSKIYGDFLLEVERIYGDIARYHPLSESVLGLTSSLSALKNEAIVRADRRNWMTRLFGTAVLSVISMIGNLAFRFDLKIAGIRWGKYKKEVVENADFRKFDGSLKMVVDGTLDQEARLRDYLESCKKAGDLVYGLHRSPEAIMTCLVFTIGQDHAHFVDGSDGGYAMAAKMLKQQMAEFKQNKSRNA